ncbi:RND family efflux transporter MFP subunit [Tamilnaduibacter salinus]|uniref:RND family efflux transporter MFP subunit n=1 Tax=Tamilnaduibacter salinus TaxID=1484056 RepID=A0A2U1CYE4_9GAMM|nr:efflux RND transporter periplasmic adaptor subunit [Tamilnaduibacter salinus]PVY77499.1 RND family efflux transporter MFP subunit [Tamilnaduibacter salinus]
MLRNSRWLVLLAAFAATALNADIRTARVERAPLEETIRLDGRIEAVQQSTVSARTAGTVIRLPFDVDDSVSAGELIVQLDDKRQQAGVEQARAARAEARANLEDANQRFARIQSVFERGLASQQELDQARNNRAAAKARLERTNAALTNAREELGDTRITAPYSGIVTERHVEIGESVQPGQPLISGLSREKLRVLTHVPQPYANHARQQGHAMVTLPDGRQLATGPITFYPYADPQTHSFRLRLPVTDDSGSLYPGMLVKVTLPVGSRSALWVPKDAVFHRGEMRAVFVLTDHNQPRLRPIRTGIEHNGRIEVLAGLTEGEPVATRPQNLFGSDALNLPDEADDE